MHILPFLEATSDGGFVISNHAHRAFYGDWHDPVRLGEGRTLMAEQLVVNHVSASYRWVQDFRRDASPGCHMVLARPSEKGWDQVVRPRSTALFTRVETVRGTREL